jgi:hypothetical protein
MATIWTSFSHSGKETYIENQKLGLLVLTEFNSEDLFSNPRFVTIL